RTRTVYCQRNDGTRVADSYCSGTKPGTSTSCSSTSGCTYSWYTGAWGSINWTAGTSNCGLAEQYRTVYCRRSDGTTMSDSYCSGSKPSTGTSFTRCTNCIYSSATAADWSERNYIYAKIKHCTANPSLCDQPSYTYTQMRNV